jgi:hypothetical protein
MAETTDLDRWLSPAIRTALEQSHCAHINQQAAFAYLRSDPAFLNPTTTAVHPALFADHGVVHARDVAQQVITVLERTHGLLIPRRSPARFERMLGYGVLLAFLHDIGMVDSSPFGRAMHPQVAARTVFSPQLRPLIRTIWADNKAGLPAHLHRLRRAGVLQRPARTVLQEMLALAMGHSKSAVPISLLNDPARLRAVLIETLTTDLQTQYEQRGAAAVPPSTPAEEGETARGEPPARVPAEAFDWLVSRHPAARRLAADAIDTVRALRAADALRQRGDVLKTSGGYEAFVSQGTAKAIYALHDGNDRLYLLEVDDPILAGEANIASSELDSDGNLRIAFHRGAFAKAEAVAFAVESAALVVDDIQRDVIESFIRPPADPAPAPPKSAQEMALLLEEIDDSVDFVAQIRQHLELLRPALRGRIRTMPSLHQTSERERALYLAAGAVGWTEETRRTLLATMRRAGHRTDLIDPDRAFQDVHHIVLTEGEVLVEAGAPAAFVYIPLGPGLRIWPLGGYESLVARPWVPLGVTGVVRGARRNATVIAEATVELLMIPKGVYLREWHQTHTPETLRLMLGGDSG